VKIARSLQPLYNHREMIQKTNVLRSLDLNVDSVRDDVTSGGTAERGNACYLCETCDAILW